MRELFRRMVFNMLIDNTDDHEKNNALLMDDAQHLLLAPAFDVLPPVKGSIPADARGPARSRFDYRERRFSEGGTLRTVERPGQGRGVQVAACAGVEITLCGRRCQRRRHRVSGAIHPTAISFWSSETT